MKTLLISIIIVAFAVIGLAISLLLKKNGRFPDTHVGHNKEMKKKGISCAKNENLGCTSVKNDPACSACSLIQSQNN